MDSVNAIIHSSVQCCLSRRSRSGLQCIHSSNVCAVRKMSSFISQEIKLVLYIVIIYTSFVYWGYVQERLFSNDYPLMSEFVGATHNGAAPLPAVGRWDMSLALNCCMATVCTAACLLIELCSYLYTGKETTQPSALVFMRLSLTCVVASPLSYEALKYISFPLMVLAKSSKPIPVMLIGVMQFGKSYSLVKYVSVLLLVSGIGMFSFYSKKPTDNTDADNPLMLQIYGIVLIFVNLILDGYTNNQQDAVFSSHKMSSLIMMKYTNMWQILWLSAFLVLSHAAGWSGAGGSELYRAVSMVLHYEGVALDLVMFCLCACVGQMCVFQLMQEFGSLVWICVSVVRKLFTVLLSVVLFNHSISPAQWVGLALTFSGILLDAGMSASAAQQPTQKSVPVEPALRTSEGSGSTSPMAEKAAAAPVEAGDAATSEVAASTTGLRQRPGRKPRAKSPAPERPAGKTKGRAASRSRSPAPESKPCAPRAASSGRRHRVGSSVNSK